MNLRSVIYIIAKEVKNSILNNKAGFKDEDDVTANTINNSKPDFNFSDDNEFDLILGADYNIVDDFIDVD